MEKRYTISAETFCKMSDIMTLLCSPRLLSTIKAIDPLTARDIISLRLDIEQIATKRVLNDLMRTYYLNGDDDGVQAMRKAKENLTPYNVAPGVLSDAEGIDMVG